MASYTRPKLGSISDANPQLHSEVSSDDLQDGLLSEFERLGEDEVRLRLQFHVYDEHIVQRAHDWLADREYARFGDDIRSVRSYASKTSKIVHDSIKLAEAAKQLAYDADGAAREARDAARTASQAVNAAAAKLRELTWIAGLALVAATVALAISVGAIAFH